MPFEDHPNFLPPSNPNATIRRYMDLPKFLSLLDRSALFFASIDSLASIDPFEGCYTETDIVRDRMQLKDTPAQYREKIKDEDTHQRVIRNNRLIREFAKKSRKQTFVNCWHAQEHESAAMWSLYTRDAGGIAIESAYIQLINAFQDFKELEVRIGMITYLDYKTESIPVDNIFSPFLYKRKSFEHEQELRALIWAHNYDENNEMRKGFLDKHFTPNGIYIPVNLKALLRRILVSPTAPRWMLELVESLVGKYGLNTPVIQSDLASSPIE